MSNLRIVPATEPDIPVILDLIQALAEYEKAAALDPQNPMPRQRLQQMKARPSPSP